MFAVIKTGGKQYRVAANDKITVGRIEGDAGSSAEFGEVLALGGDQPSFGVPFVDGARVVYEIVEHTRGDKVIAFKKRRRQNSKRKRGHRQDLTVIRITDILAAGQKAGSKAEAKTAAPAPAAEEAAQPASNEE